MDHSKFGWGTVDEYEMATHTEATCNSRNLRPLHLCQPGHQQQYQVHLGHQLHRSRKAIEDTSTLFQLCGDEALAGFMSQVA